MRRYQGYVRQIEQLYALLELADFVQVNLPTLWTALNAGSGSGLPTNMGLLYDRLTDDSRADRFEIESDGSLEMLGDLLMAFKGHIELVRGQGDFPATDLDFRSFFTANQLPALEDAVNAAID